jgi:hypothetical protein
MMEPKENELSMTRTLCLKQSDIQAICLAWARENHGFGYGAYAATDGMMDLTITENSTVTGPSHD